MNAILCTKFLRLSGWLVILAALSGCATRFYANTPTGESRGRIDVEWVEPNWFVYRPRDGDRLTYMTSDKRKIQPEEMYTDGGSIPRIFWSTPDFGPWDFAPGYIIHDWLFHQHHCKLGDYQDYDFPRSASILAEAIKTQMERSGKPDAAVLWAIYEAVSSEHAQHLWDTGKCKNPPGRPAGAPLPAAERTIKLFSINAN